ncbi:MAG: hypothetical protein ACE5JP_17260 [Candidatus Bipolaricaulia bacterium]
MVKRKGTNRATTKEKEKDQVKTKALEDLADLEEHVEADRRRLEELQSKITKLEERRTTLLDWLHYEPSGPEGEGQEDLRELDAQLAKMKREQETIATQLPDDEVRLEELEEVAEVEQRSEVKAELKQAEGSFLKAVLGWLDAFETLEAARTEENEIREHLHQAESTLKAAQTKERKARKQLDQAESALEAAQDTEDEARKQLDQAESALEVAWDEEGEARERLHQAENAVRKLGGKVPGLPGFLGNPERMRQEIAELLEEHDEDA